MSLRRLCEWTLLAGLLPFSSGCLVPQPPGKGAQTVVTEPRTGAQYFLYLPEAYVKNNGRHPVSPERRWPLVMTFHGMKPYDTWDRQAHEWEYEADNYGYIVCAPWLQTSDSFMEYPLRREHGYVLADKERVIAVMDHVFATTRADPSAVLSTSWSCGGYLAHYFPNRYPKRFSCIATRLSNFSSDLMLESTVPLYRHVPVALFIGDGDFPACKSESEKAVAWYQSRGFKVRGKTIDNIGHARIPQCAAAFFAEQLGIKPLHPERAAQSLAQVRMTDYFPSGELLASVAPHGTSAGAVLSPAAASTPVAATRTPSKEPVQVARATPAPPQRIEGSTAAVSPPPSGSSPVSGASAARAYDSPRANWLEPPATPVTVRRPVASEVSSEAVTQALESEPPPAVRTESLSEQPPPATPPRAAPPPFRLRNAGPAVYPTDKLARLPLEEPARIERSDELASLAMSDIAAPAAAAPSALPTTAQPQRTRARDVTIKLSGPAVGRAPHYLAFSVDLPPQALEGADFLWMDNGVWICDEPRGVKILDTPGWHRISVLVLTRDGQEYRGEARVRVLGSAPAGGRRGATASTR